MNLFCIVLIIAAYIPAYVLAQIEEPPKYGKYHVDLRLPPTVMPTLYYVKLRPNLEGNFTIDGEVRIHLDIKETTDRLILHMKDIIPNKNTIGVRPAYENIYYTIKDQNYDADKELYMLLLKPMLPAESKVILTMSFTGFINHGLNGFYRTSYVDKNGNIRLAAATQFQATNARRAFPCFDEPAIKAKFDIVLERRDGMVALSNMPEKKTLSLKDGWTQVHFQRTVPMSTSLLAFVVADFDSHTVANKDLNIQLKIWSRKNALHQTKFAGKIASEGLLFLQNYLGIKYPLPKLDFVAVPQMGPNAMENWGLIIHRESSLLLDPLENAVSNKKWIAYVISHELTHQWFGNLVTMSWWTDLWLNEGFATYLGTEVVDQIRPSYHVMDEFVVNSLQSVMVLDSVKSSLPVRVAVENPQEIQSIFGPIAYKKGASVVRMMKHFMGEKAFRNGLTLYLNGLKYGVSDQDDLWEYMTESARSNEALPSTLTIKTIMDSWTLQPGFPVVHATFTGKTLNIQQKRFLHIEDHDIYSSRWHIPISWVTQNGGPNFDNTMPNKWLSESNMTIDVETMDTPGWIILNPQQTGFYRVNYDEENWNRLIDQFLTNHSAIHPINRAQIVDDVFNLAKAGYLNYVTVFKLASYITKEDNSLPWKALSNNINYINQMLKGTSSYGAFQQYILSIIHPIYDIITSGDNYANSALKELKEKITAWTCALGYKKCIIKAQHLLGEWKKDPDNESIISGATAATMLCTAIRAGNEEDWNFLWNRYQHASSRELKRHLVFALGCSNDLWILQRYLETALSPDSGLHRQYAPKIFSVISDSSTGSLVAWHFLRENWPFVRDYVKSAMFALPAVLKRATDSLNSEVQYEEIVNFAQKYKGQLASAEPTLKQAIDRTKLNALWMKSNFHSITAILEYKGFSSRLSRRKRP